MHSLLFIDDEEGVRRSILRALKREPYRTVAVTGGAAGIAFVKANRLSVGTVISDFRMPGLDGLQTLGAIGALNPEITRIILTGYATMEAAIAATNAGIDGFLTKPFDNVELRAKIREINVRKRLRQFVSEPVYREITAAGGTLAPRIQQATILFSDIRGFSRMSRRAAPESIATFLNDRYFAPMGEIAFRYRGTVDKHLGDGMMVVFGSPLAHPKDPLRAVRAAVAMQRRAAAIDSRLAGQNGLRLRMGIGIATGEVFSGVLGSLRKKEFTSIGGAVNLAARLQELARGGEIVISADTCARVAGRVATRALDPVQVKGRDAPVRVHQVLY